MPVSPDLQNVVWDKSGQRDTKGTSHPLAANAIGVKRESLRHLTSFGLSLALIVGAAFFLKAIPAPAVGVEESNSGLGASAATTSPEESISTLESRPLYREVPDAEMLLPTGQRVHLSTLWDDKPLLITLFYKNCSGACLPFMRSLKIAVEKAGGLGTEYSIASLSFDPNDTAEDLGKYAKSLGLEGTASWKFGVSDPSAIEALAEAIGFWYKLEPQTGQFDHPTMLAAVSGGKIQRVLLGNTLSEERFTELTRELKGEFIPYYSKPGRKTVFRCVEWSNSTGSLWPHWGLLFLIFPGAAALSLAAWIFRKR